MKQNSFCHFVIIVLPRFIWIGTKQPVDQFISILAVDYLDMFVYLVVTSYYNHKTIIFKVIINVFINQVTPYKSNELIFRQSCPTKTNSSWTFFFVTWHLGFFLILHPDSRCTNIVSGALAHFVVVLVYTLPLIYSRTSFCFCFSFDICYLYWSETNLDLHPKILIQI